MARTADPHRPGTDPASVMARRSAAAVATAIAVAGGCSADTVTGAKPPVSYVALSPASASVAKGATQSFTAFGVAADGQHVAGDFTWTSTGGTISQGGSFQAPDATGSFRVTASSPAWNHSGTAIVHVYSALPLATVAVDPVAVQLQVAGSRRLQAVLLDSLGESVAAGPVAWQSTHTGVATVDQAGLVTAVDTGHTTIVATSGGRSGSAAVVVVPDSARSWPAEPSDFSPLADEPFNSLTPAGWSLLDNTAGLVTLGTDAAAPFSPPSVLQLTYPVGFGGGNGPGAMERILPGLRELYVGVWWKPSDPWQGHPSNVNKLAFVFAGGTGGDAYLAMYGSPGGPYELRVQRQFAGDDAPWLVPNVAHVPVVLGQWHRVEWLLAYNTTSAPANGVIRWWLDGQLIGDYGAVEFPGEPMVDFKLGGIWGGVGGSKSEVDHFWYDHARLSTP